METTVVWPRFFAISKGDPCLLLWQFDMMSVILLTEGYLMYHHLWSGLAPWTRRTSTQFTWPLLAANHRGVLPSLQSISTANPHCAQEHAHGQQHWPVSSSNRFNMVLELLQAAKWMTVIPPWVNKHTTSQWAFHHINRKESLHSHRQ